VKDGIEQGHRPELAGGGLIRSLGGWAEVKTNRLNKADRIKSDERIPGDSEFVVQVFAEADETFDRRYKLKSQGYDIARIEQKVVDLSGIKKDELYSGSRKKPISEARSVLGLTQPVIGYAVDRGEEVVKKESSAKERWLEPS